MMQVGIIGAGGYAGVNLLALLLKHPKVEIAWLMSEDDHEGKKISELYPQLRGICDIECRTLKVLDSNLINVDLIFLALPHGIAMQYVPKILSAGKKVVDLGADYRFIDVDIFNRWYHNTPHKSANLCKEAVFGLPELYKEEIKKTKLVGNPGCYPTASILGLAPLIKKDLLDLTSISIDAKSGVSGAGRGASTKTIYCERNEGIMPYAVISHRHTGEIEYQISKIAGQPETRINFVPHLTPMTRGILTTTYAKLKGQRTDFLKVYRDFYRNAPFVRILDSEPCTKYVVNSNYCDIYVEFNLFTNTLIIMSAIDNLIKGAAGQAVQNMNLISGYEETLGLKNIAVYP
ncbi:N-acetyl-gamma-glutamyl-phosphate reductase [Candidatus Margulisiibacteriota bacterium]